MPNIILQPAFVLHRRPYGETSCFIELFTLEYGRVTAVAKGVRKISSKNSGLLQPFIALSISCRGKNELMTLTQVELASMSCLLQGSSLFIGLYLNELLLSLLQPWDNYPNLYYHYEKLIKALHQAEWHEALLRSFEMQLLKELGYGLFPDSEVLLTQQFLTECFYQLTPEQGWCKVTIPSLNDPTLFSGEHLLAIARETWHNTLILQEAKRLMRLAIETLLGKQCLYSRRLFISKGFQGVARRQHR